MEIVLGLTHSADEIWCCGSRRSCQDTLRALPSYPCATIEPPNAHMEPWMSWRLIQGRSLPSPISRWNRLQHPPRDPERDKVVKKRSNWMIDCADWISKEGPCLFPGVSFGSCLTVRLSTVVCHHQSAIISTGASSASKDETFSTSQKAQCHLSIYCSDEIGCFPAFTWAPQRPLSLSLRHATFFFSFLMVMNGKSIPSDFGKRAWNDGDSLSAGVHDVNALMEHSLWRSRKEQSPQRTEKYLLLYLLTWGCFHRGLKTTRETWICFI